ADTVGFGKPHPAVFLHCAAQLGSTPLQCIVFEDSLNGIIAAKAARMKVIAIPDDLHFDNPKFALADKKYRSLAEVVPAADF
ncbi:MAG TPA: HAD-IA family hydrolase, partial [Chitinophagaceae bacterium]|nr:HAD-IA family hydrolase [Chitinophagaceae bacterium]